MITQETRETQGNSIKTWCESCAKTIYLKDAGLDPLGEDALTFAFSIAERHERLHPKHNIFVMESKRVPTIRELKNEIRTL